MMTPELLNRHSGSLINNFTGPKNLAIQLVSTRVVYNINVLKYHLVRPGQISKLRSAYRCSVIELYREREGGITTHMPILCYQS